MEKSLWRSEVPNDAVAICPIPGCAGVIFTDGLMLIRSVECDCCSYVVEFDQEPVLKRYLQAWCLDFVVEKDGQALVDYVGLHPDFKRETEEIEKLASRTYRYKHGSLRLVKESGYNRPFYRVEVKNGSSQWKDTKESLLKSDVKEYVSKLQHE